MKALTFLANVRGAKIKANQLPTWRGFIGLDVLITDCKSAAIEALVSQADMVDMWGGL